jgi:hypothetical protein
MGAKDLELRKFGVKLFPTVSTDLPRPRQTFAFQHHLPIRSETTFMTAENLTGVMIEGQ